jgi:hypothetical protein
MRGGMQKMATEKRLIDANKLPYSIAVDDSGKPIFYVKAEDIDKAPTVDAVEVVHGEWIDGYAMHDGKEVYKSIDCSHCEEIFKIESHDREYWKARFKVCPFCGAIMDGGNEDG